MHVGHTWRGCDGGTVSTGALAVAGGRDLCEESKPGRDLLTFRGEVNEY